MRPLVWRRSPPNRNVTPLPTGGSTSSRAPVPVAGTCWSSVGDATARPAPTLANPLEKSRCWRYASAAQRKSPRPTSRTLASAAIRDLRKLKPVIAEASAIEGRLYKENGEEDKAIAAFKKAITEGRGFQPEAYTGLGLLYQERAEGFGPADMDAETAAYTEAAKNYAAAIKQLGFGSDAPVVMQLLGRIYEQQKRYKEAIALYEDFLRRFPTSDEADAVRSFIVQIKNQMNGDDNR